MTMMQCIQLTVRAPTKKASSRQQYKNERCRRVLHEAQTLEQPLNTIMHDIQAYPLTSCEIEQKSVASILDIRPPPNKNEDAGNCDQYYFAESFII